MKNLIPKRVMEYIIITFAVVLMDVGIYVFKFPNNFSFGGGVKGNGFQTSILSVEGPWFLSFPS